jgi:hypothetical protein
MSLLLLSLLLLYDEIGGESIRSSRISSSAMSSNIHAFAVCQGRKRCGGRRGRRGFLGLVAIVDNDNVGIGIGSIRGAINASAKGATRIGRSTINTRDSINAVDFQAEIRFQHALLAFA